MIKLPLAIATLLLGSTLQATAGDTSKFLDHMQGHWVSRRGPLTR
jgi:hypothetical protein